MNSPLVSVIISTYNSERFIKGRLEDLVAQTIFDKIEIIIVDSGSQQNEREIVSEYTSRHFNIKYIRTVDRETIYKAWNRGIQQSTGKYITNANTDDRLRKDALEILSNAMETHPDIGMVYADQFIHHTPNQDFHQISSQKRFHRQPYTHLKLLFGYLVGPQSLWKSSLHFQDNIWFDEKFEIAGDYDFVLRVAEKTELLYVDEVLGAYYKSVDNSNKEFSNLERTLNEVFSIQEMYARKYLELISQKELNRLKRQIERRNFIPTIFYRILVRLRPNNPFYSHIHWCWFSSLVAEKMGDLVAAKKYCECYKNNPNALLINRQYKHLSRIS